MTEIAKSITVSVGASVEPTAEFDAVAKALGYIKKRTCLVLYVKHGPFFDVLRFSCCGYEWAENRTDKGATEPDPNFCPNCGAKVVEHEL